MCGIFAYIDNLLKASVIDKSVVIKYRGPDYTCVEDLHVGDLHYHLCFHRLAIMDVSDNANRILSHEGIYLLCNGEIYNYMHLIKKYGLHVSTGSDCEVILRLYIHFEYDVSRFISELSGDFAFIIIDTNTKCTYFSRDRIGVRPLYFSSNNGLIIGSEAKCIYSGSVEPVLPGVLYKYTGITEGPTMYKWSPQVVPSHLTRIEAVRSILRTLLIDSVRARLMADRPVGYLLSGGLDSSLIASIGNTLTTQRIVTFSIGFPDSPDLKAARIMASYLNSIHHEIILTRAEVLGCIDSVIYHNESYDITTTRASIPMYLLGKYIRENTDIKVILSGEGSDELFGGYLYFHKAPTVTAFEEETSRLINELYLYDVLRADRTISAHGLELRVPFLDADVLSFVRGLDTVYKVPQKCKTGVVIEKALLRDTFSDYLPENICYRQKEAFSDGVGYNSVALLKEYSHNQMAYNTIVPTVPLRYAIPDSDEGKLYYVIFCKYYQNCPNIYIRRYWMPQWCGDVRDPSATVLKDLHTTTTF